MSDAQKALAMIDRAYARGRASVVSLTRPGSGGVCDPITQTCEGGSDPVTYTAIGVKVGYEQSVINGLNIRSGDQRLFVPALGFIRPDVDDHITVGGETYFIISVEVVAPGNEDVLYVIQVRNT